MMALMFEQLTAPPPAPLLPPPPVDPPVPRLCRACCVSVSEVEPSSLALPQPAAAASIKSVPDNADIVAIRKYESMANLSSSV
jgi:hypothetical protein